jgi:type I restriction enzyme S subunit
MNALPTSGFMTGEVQSKKYNGGVKFKDGDILMARITPCLENGKTGLVTLLKENEIGFGSTEFIVIRG